MKMGMYCLEFSKALANVRGASIRSLCYVVFVLFCGEPGIGFHPAHAAKVIMAFNVTSGEAVSVRRSLPLSATAPATLKKIPKFKYQKPLFGWFLLAGKRIHVAFDGNDLGSFDYGTIFVDANLNNDLSDDVARSRDALVNVNLDIEGQRVPYVFMVRAERSMMVGNGVNASSESGHRFEVRVVSSWSGVVKLNDKLVQLRLADQNVNGYFNDIGGVESNGQLRDGDSLSIKEIDLPAATPKSALMSRYFWFDEKVYALQVHPSGNPVWVAPVTNQLGMVRCPYDRTTLSLITKHGPLLLTTSQPVIRLPAGEYSVSWMSVGRIEDRVLWTATVYSPKLQPLTQVAQAIEELTAKKELPVSPLPPLKVRSGQTFNLPPLSTLRIYPRFTAGYGGAIECSAEVRDSENRFVAIGAGPVNKNDTQIWDRREDIGGMATFLAVDSQGKQVARITIDSYTRQSVLIFATRLSDLVQEEPVTLMVSVTMNTGPFPYAPIPPVKIEINREGSNRKVTVDGTEMVPMRRYNGRNIKKLP